MPRWSRSWSWWLAVALAAQPVLAADKKKDEKKGKETPAAAAPQQHDAVAEAEAKLAAGDADGAVAALDRAKATDARAALRLGVLREARGELDLAIDAYRSAGERLSGPGKGEALGRMAVVAVTRGLAEAGAHTDAAVAADPEGVWPTIALAYRRAHEGRHDEAVALAQKAAAAAAAGAGAQAALGHALAAKGDMAGAEAAYRQATAAEPKALGPAIGLAAVLRQTGRAAEAEPMLKQVIDAAPGAVEAYKELARVKIALGRPQEALGDANIAAAMADDDADAKALVIEVKVARALQAVAGGQIDLAVQDLVQLRDQNPDSSAVRLGLGRAQIARRDAAAALAELQKAVELEANSAAAHYHLGYVQHVMRQGAAAAVPAFERAVALEPGSVQYRTSLGAALVDAGQLDRAVAELSKVVGTEGYAGWEAPFYLGVAHFKANRFKEAVPFFDRSLAVRADNAQAEGLLAWSYVGLKDTENFKVHGARAKKLGFKDPELMNRLAQVEAGQKFK